jgi:phosphoenolpyruvate-protein kinase (PTS system EI component)
MNCQTWNIAWPNQLIFFLVGQGNTGGSLSHGAIVAREFGIPAVINVPGAMVAIYDSQTVIVDGEEGKVYLKSSMST